MFPLFETIKVQDGVVQNAEFHQKRYEKSYHTLFKKHSKTPLLQHISIPSAFQKGTVKLKVNYSDCSKEFHFSKYCPKHIQQLKLIEDNTIDYSLKYADRSHLNQLYAKKETCDDILIVKNGFITDCSYTNIIFFDGITWLTSSTPLLQGTCRKRLLDAKLIREESIKLEDLKRFKGFQLINAMLDFDPNHLIPIKNIIT